MQRNVELLKRWKICLFAMKLISGVHPQKLQRLMYCFHRQEFQHSGHSWILWMLRMKSWLIIWISKWHNSKWIYIDMLTYVSHKTNELNFILFIQWNWVWKAELSCQLWVWIQEWDELECLPTTSDCN